MRVGVSFIIPVTVEAGNRAESDLRPKATDRLRLEHRSGIDRQKNGDHRKMRPAKHFRN